VCASDDVRRAVHDLYLDIRNRLAGTDPAAALAFGLAGCWPPRPRSEPPSGRRSPNVRATLGRAVRQAEQAMWDAGVVAAIGKPATIIPDHDESGPAAAELADAGMASPAEARARCASPR
jgi:hypothetical protein